jgi:hypothetical protein
MDALMASYASGSDDDEPAPVTGAAPDPEASAVLPPPPLDLLQPPNFIGMILTHLLKPIPVVLGISGDLLTVRELYLLLQITLHWRRGIASGASPMWKAFMRCMSTSLVRFFRPPT